MTLTARQLNLNGLHPAPVEPQLSSLALFIHQVGELVIGQNGIFSTPAVSCIIRKIKARGKKNSEAK